MRICILHIRQRRAILVGQGEVAIVDLAQLGRGSARLIRRCGTGFRFHVSKNRANCVTLTIIISHKMDKAQARVGIQMSAKANVRICSVASA